ncbi:MAG: hypothetical protein LBS37_09565 [Treponema sp.]|jgi:hypothetical protein|nr:hypothetical protein [Treponema sp.]
MRKYLRFITGFVLCAAVLVFLYSCLNPIGFTPEDFKLQIKGDITIDGALETKDITAASTYIVNMSNSLDFLDITITQKENPKLATETPPYLISVFNNTKDSNNNWKIVKTKYVQASDIEYEVELNIQQRPGGSSSVKKTADVYATQSKGIYYVWMYRTEDASYINEQKANGVSDEFADIVVVSPNDPNMRRPFPIPKPGDTNTTIDINVGSSDNAAIQDILQKIANTIVNIADNTGEKTPEEENGSVPPIISPKNRATMGTFVVVNLSRTRNVDWVQFVDEGRTFGDPLQNVIHTINSVSVQNEGGTVAFPAVAAQDRRAIALQQGQYKITAGHNGTERTAMKTGIIVPSNDPQTTKEHYLYFYRDKSGNYVVNVEKPGENDMDPTDVLPPSQGSGVGRITLVNKTTGAVLDSVTLEARDYPARGDKTWTYTDFARGAPLNINASDDVDMIGTSLFPIDGYFIASVNAITSEGACAVTRLVYLNNTIAEIIVTDNDVAARKVPGARINVLNTSSTISVVESVKITDAKTSANYQVYTTNVPNGNAVTFDVINSIGMPIIEGRDYTAQASVTVTKQFTGIFEVNGEEVENPVLTYSGAINVSIAPDGKLYGANGPASHLRTITVSESDLIAGGLIPPTPPGAPGFIPVTDVVILNGEYAGDGVKFFARDGNPRTIQWLAIPDDATAFNPLHGNNDPRGYWKVGALDAMTNAAHYSLTRTGVLTVQSSWSYDYLNVAYVVENGIAQGTRNPGLNTVGSLLLDGVDLSKDFVKVIKLKTPPPSVTAPPPPPGGGTQGLILNYTGKNAPSDLYSINLIEVYERPEIIAQWQSVHITPSGPAPATGTVDDVGYHYYTGGVRRYQIPLIEAGATGVGNFKTGRTGWWWEEYPCDEFNDRFGSTSEGWLQGFAHGRESALWHYPGPSGYKSMGFNYWGTGNTVDSVHGGHYSGRVEPYFLGSFWTGRSGDPHAAQRAAVNARSAAAGVTGTWVTKVSDDGKFNAAGEQILLSVPKNKGVIWLRMRTDYYSALTGYHWKASGTLEWFCYNPDTDYQKDASGNIIIDVYPYAAPYMNYRK